MAGSGVLCCFKTMGNLGGSVARGFVASAVLKICAAGDVEFLLYIATLLGSTGEWISVSTLPHCWGAVGSGTPSVDCHAAGQ